MPYQSQHRFFRDGEHEAVNFANGQTFDHNTAYLGTPIASSTGCPIGVNLLKVIWYQMEKKNKI